MKKATTRVADMKAAGATRIVVLVKEDLDTEVADFRAGFWPGEVLLDEGKCFFSAIGGGAIHHPYSVASFLAMVLNPFSKARTKTLLSNAKQMGVAGNMKGEGFGSGGVYVVRQDGKHAYAYLEEETGDHAEIEDVIEAVKAAVIGEEYVLAPSSIPGAEQESKRMSWKDWAGRTSGPDGYQLGDITRGIAASLSRKACRL